MHLEVEEGDEEGEDFDFEESDDEGKLAFFRVVHIFACHASMLEWTRTLSMERVRCSFKLKEWFCVQSVLL
jgi:hypothetical protein